MAEAVATWCDKHGCDADICAPCNRAAGWQPGPLPACHGLVARRVTDCSGCSSKIKLGDPIYRLACGFFGCEDCWSTEGESHG